MHRTACTIVIALCGAPASAQLAVEVSEDGHLTAAPGVHAPEARAARGVPLPFGAAPDWDFQMRRPVGGMQVIDINQDGFNDLVVGCYSSNSFPPYPDYEEIIFLNTGTELEATPSWTSAIETHCGDVQVGDVNGDTIPDIVTIHGGVRADSVRVYHGVPNALPSTSPSWTSSTTPSVWGTSGLLVDLDKDNDLDLVTTNQGLSPDPFRPMFQFENLGTALELNPTWRSLDSDIQNGLDAADYDGDTWVDVGVAKWANWESAVYKNNAGTLGTTPDWTRGETDTDKGAAFADINMDGTMDLLIGGDDSTLWSNDGAGNLLLEWTANPGFSGPQEVHAWDAEGDGDMDFFEVHFSDGKTHIYLNESGVLSTTPSWTYDAPEVGSALAFGDINGDGRNDLVIGYAGDTCIRVFYAIPMPCFADCDASGSLNIDDIDCFVAGFLGSDLATADCDGNGTLNIDDIDCFIASFLAGCP